MPDNGLYVLSTGGSAVGADDWVQPKPIGVAIEGAVVDETELDADDLDEIETYVDRDAIAEMLDDEDADQSESVSFTVEGHEVTVDGSGHIAVE